MTDAWTPQSVTDMLIRLFVEIGWWGLIIVALGGTLIRHGWPWKRSSGSR